MMYNTASDNTRKIMDRINYQSWATSDSTPTIEGASCSNVVAPSSGCFQRFRSFQDRNSVVNGQRYCTNYCPITFFTLNDTITPATDDIPGYPPVAPANAARIQFNTYYNTILIDPPVIQIEGTSNFEFTAYLGKNTQNQLGQTSGSGSFMYTINNTYVNYTNKVYIDITSNISTVESLLYNSGGIKDIINLKALYNLKELMLDNNHIYDLNQIKYNIGIDRLYLRNNNISNISPISNLTNINHLYLGYNSIQDISPLQNMVALENLDIENNNVSTISALANKTALNSINISHNKIYDISPLAQSTNIIYFAAEHNNITSVSALLGMTKLLQINLVDNQIQDINPLLIMLANAGRSGGILNINYNGTSGLTTQGSAALATLRSRGWVVYL
jgi:hypothetical protein